MPIKSTAARAVSQAPLKEARCAAGCGAVVLYRTNPRILCPTCRPHRRAAQVRASVATQRRKRGVPEIKGKEIHCARCGNTVTLNRSTRAKFCAPCRVLDARERARHRVRAASRERGAPEIGSLEHCRHCGAGFERRGARNYLCPPCGKRSISRSLTPEQRAKARLYKREWSERAGPEVMSEYQKRSRARRKQNPGFAINERMSAAIRGSLVAGKGGKGWQSLVGYSLAELMTHLERQFLRGMSWENRGDWHIDHIVPLNSFKFKTPDDPGFRAAWALTNLRPLWATDNLTKSGRIMHLL